MNAEVDQVSKALAEFDAVSTGLAVLRQQFGGVVFDVTTTRGMDEARQARAAVRDPRYRVEQIRKDAKAPIIKLGKDLDATAKRITDELLAIEKPIDDQIKFEEDRKEREKQARIDAELARVKAIQDRIDALRTLPTKAANKSSEQIKALVEQASAIVIDETFAEFIETAKQAHDASVAALRGLHGMAVEQEQERIRIAAERAELEQLRAAQQKRDAEEKAARDAEAARLKAERDAEAAKQAEAVRLEREKLAAERREQEAAAKAQADKLAAEQAAHTAKVREEEARLAAERADMERRQEEARLAAEAAKPKPAIVRPTDPEILAAVAIHFAVPVETAADWLRDFGRKKKAA